MLHESIGSKRGVAGSAVARRRVGDGGSKVIARVVAAGR